MAIRRFAPDLFGIIRKNASTYTRIPRFNVTEVRLGNKNYGAPRANFSGFLPIARQANSAAVGMLRFCNLELRPGVEKPHLLFHARLAGALMPLFETATDLVRDVERIRRRRYGMIEVANEQFVQIRFSPWPRLWSWPDLGPLSNPYHRRKTGNRCFVYFNQPWRCSNFLALRFAVSTTDATYATCRLAARVLDEVARLKRTDALLCDASNFRISDRLLRRWGWESHLPSRWHRHYIKRFYGKFAPPLALDHGRVMPPAMPPQVVEV